MAEKVPRPSIVKSFFFIAFLDENVKSAIFLRVSSVLFQSDATFLRVTSVFST